MTFTPQHVLPPEVEATLLPNPGTTDPNNGCAAELVHVADWPSGVLDSITFQPAAPEETPEDDYEEAYRRLVKDPSLEKKAVSSNSSCNHTASRSTWKTCCKYVIVTWLSSISARLSFLFKVAL